MRRSRAPLCSSSLPSARSRMQGVFAGRARPRARAPRRSSSTRRPRRSRATRWTSTHRRPSRPRISADEAEPAAASPPTPGRGVGSRPRPPARAERTPQSRRLARMLRQAARALPSSAPSGSASRPTWRRRSRAPSRRRPARTRSGRRRSFGNAGTADVTLLLDDAGHLAGSQHRRHALPGAAARDRAHAGPARTARLHGAWRRDASARHARASAGTTCTTACTATSSR